MRLPQTAPVSKLDTTMLSTGTLGTGTFGTGRFGTGPMRSVKSVSDLACRVFTLVCALVIVGMVQCIMFGWLTNRMQLALMGSSVQVMRFNTTVLFTATGLALVCIALRQLWLSRILAAFVALAAGATALQYFTGFNLGIDDLLFKNRHSEWPISGDRMSLNSAICLLLLGTSILFTVAKRDRNWQYFVAALLASAALAISCVTIIGNAAGLSDALAWGGGYGMAQTTAIAVTLCASCVLLWAVAGLRDKHEDIWGYLGIANDITRQKKFEEELHQARRAAEDANKAKSEFLANVSHEIRTPMNGIIGMTELALNTRLTMDQKEYLGAIQESAGALLTVINDILDFSKVEAGMLTLEEIDYNLQAKLGSVMQALSTRTHDKGLELIYHIEHNVPEWVTGDPGRLRQIVVNLVGNAIKFTERGEVSLRVQLAEPPAEGSRDCVLHFTVRDTGLGIPAEKQRVIFDAFAQADTSTSRRYGGTGLGLTISARLVELMGGEIWVESELGLGSTFHFTVRLGIADPQAHDSRAYTNTFDSSTDEQKAKMATVQKTLRPLRILLAEDNKINRSVATRMLKMENHEVTVAENGKRALEILETDSFDVVLMDVQMPEMDGFETTARIREKEKETELHLPIIAMTAHALKGDRERCLVAGMDSYVAKPMKSADLIAVLNSIDSMLPEAITHETNSTEAASGATEGKVCDLADALERVQGDTEFFCQLVSMLKEEAPQSLTEIKTAIDTENAGQLDRAAHKLKSALVPFVATAAVQSAQTLETMGHENNLSEADREFEVLHREVAAALTELNQFVSQCNNGQATCDSTSWFK
jgi:signal transduction histidine kinase/DNA-binding NarL/FixJ family response regulator